MKEKIKKIRNFTKMDIKIRKLNKKDFAKGFFESLDNLFKVGLTIKQAEKIFSKTSANPVYNVFVAETENKIVGTATLLIEQKFLLRGAKFGYIEDVAVRKGFEGRGIGTLLIRTAVKKAKELGCLRVRLTTEDKNVIFYRKCGFKVKEKMMELIF